MLRSDLFQHMLCNLVIRDKQTKFDCIIETIDVAFNENDTKFAFQGIRELRAYVPRTPQSMTIDSHIQATSPQEVRGRWLEH